MKLGHLRLLLATVAIWIGGPTAHGQTQKNQSTATAWIERGKAELSRSFFSIAETDFRKAIELEPNNAQAYTLLARALLGELFPNLSLFADTEGILPKAEEAARRAVELSPADADALCVAGIVNYKIATTLRDPREKARRLNAAKNAFDRALLANPNSVEAHYELARMFSDQAGDAVVRAHIQSGMKMGPIVNAEVRRVLQTRYSASIEEAMSHARRVLEIDPKFGPAMGQMAGLLYIRAALRNSDAEYAGDVESAKSWQAKEAALIASKQPRTTAPIDPASGAVIGAMPSAPPPPPSPIPPRRP